jgi:spore maturation protein B
MAALLVPLLIAGILLYGLRQGVDLFSAMTDGARSGLKTTARILPSLVVLMAAVSLFRACGIQTLLSRMLRPVFSLLGIPAETAPLMLIRPFSGSAALAVGSDLMTRYGADSLVGRTAAVMLAPRRPPFTPWPSTSAPPGSERPATRSPLRCAPIWRAFSPPA